MRRNNFVIKKERPINEKQKQRNVQIITHSAETPKILQVLITLILLLQTQTTELPPVIQSQLVMKRTLRPQDPCEITHNVIHRAESTAPTTESMK